MEASRESIAADRVCSGVTESLRRLGNEPSLGLYYVMEHIQRSVPALVSDKATMSEVTSTLKGVNLDASYALQDMDAISSGATLNALKNVNNLAIQATRQMDGATVLPHGPSDSSVRAARTGASRAAELAAFASPSVNTEFTPQLMSDISPPMLDPRRALAFALGGGSHKNHDL